MAKPEQPYIVFECVGEPSKDIMGTAVVSALKRSFPERPIVVTTLHPEIWLHNPHIHRVYKLGNTPYFFDEYVEGGQSTILRLDPYHSQEFLKGATSHHIIDLWCTLCGVIYKGEKPELYFTQRELEVAKKILTSDKPIFLIQAQGEIGGIPYPFAWSRDIDLATAAEIVRHMNEEGYRSVQVAPSDKQVIPNAERLTLDTRLLMACINFSAKRLFIDSFLHHAATALDKPSVILWNSLTPDQHGYELHSNIVPKEELPDLQKNILKQLRIFRMEPPFVQAPVWKPHSVATIIEALDTL